MPLTAHFYHGLYGGLYSARFQWDPAEFPLKPCPFCGSDWLTLEKVPGLFYQAGCRNCGCEGPMRRNYEMNDDAAQDFPTEGECLREHRAAIVVAVEMWNACERGG